MKLKITYQDEKKVIAEEIPKNPKTGEPYFTIKDIGWGGKWQSGETVTIPKPAIAE